MSEPDIRILGLGAGVQSTTLLLMTIEGILPKPDAAIFADTQGELPSLYEHLDRLGKLAEAAGFPLLKVTKGDLAADAIDPAHKYASIPYFTQFPPGPCDACNATGSVGDERCKRCRGTRWWDGKGMGRRQCTSEYKLAPVNRKVRELLGASPPDFARVPKGRAAEVWIGFSADEIGRVSDKDRVLYLTKRFPLLEMGMTRRDCQYWLTERGWGDTAKSACVFCSYQGNRQWRNLRDNDPHEWEIACRFDEAIRHGGANPLPAGACAYLHASRVPLREAPIDKVTPLERKDQQGDLLALLAEQRNEEREAEERRLEEGNPDGCGPWACRSGAPVTISVRGAA